MRHAFGELWGPPSIGAKSRADGLMAPLQGAEKAAVEAFFAGKRGTRQLIETHPWRTLIQRDAMSIYPQRNATGTMPSVLMYRPG